MSSKALATLVALASAGGALAQDVTDDWEIVRQPEQKTVFAFVPMTTGLTIAFRCVDGNFGAVIAGLPEVRRREKTRTLRIRVGDEAISDTRWNVTTDRSVAIADYPAPLARELRAGGPVSITIPGGADDGRNLRHDLVLPASSVAIDETLAACNRPVVDPRDALLPEIEEGGLPAGVTWAQPPRPRYPATNYAQGYAVVSCAVRPEGSLGDCVVESEFPFDAGFGRNGLRSVGDARIASPGETPGQYAPRIIAFRINYLMR
ncbi:hypothetical protein [Brevundimonas sp. R86498]|uniref:hypothetical protein n=1 Tax=Brevundimonas sp. R86498 TaxID=3093845 RepID=UPI0037C73ED2